MVDDLLSMISPPITPKKIGRPKEGPVCRKGHVNQRYPNGTCRTCALITSTEWAKRNPERRAATAKAWSERHPEKRKAIQRAYDLANKQERAAKRKARYEINKEAILRRGAELRAQRKDKIRERDRAKRARKRNAEGSHSAKQVLVLFDIQKQKCAWCRRSIKNRYHVDHIIPLALGGSDFIRNIQLLCPTCNVRKSATHPLDWARKEGRLL